MARGVPFKKGNPGKPKGATTKVNRLVKEVFADVFHDLQADPKHNLKEFAHKYPRDFYALATKLIPTEITGGNGGPLETVIRFINEQERINGSDTDTASGTDKDSPGQESV